MKAAPPGCYSEVIYVGEYKGADIFRHVKEVPAGDAYRLVSEYRWQWKESPSDFCVPDITLEGVIRRIDKSKARKAGRLPLPTVEAETFPYSLPQGEDPGDTWVQTPEQARQAERGFDLTRLKAAEKGLDDLERRLQILRQDYGSLVDRVYNLEGDVHRLKMRRD